MDSCGRALRRCGMAFCFMALAAHSHAEVATTISGFGTLGGTFTSDGLYAYHHDSSEFKGAGNNFDVGLESRLGLQGTLDFGSGFTVTAQELLRERGNRLFDPGTEWAYVQYSPEADLKVRLGRVALATFLFSDSRYVGFAAPWVHAPTEVYAQEPFDYVDGGQVWWQVHAGPVGIQLQSSYGSTSVNLLFASKSLQSAGQVFNGSIALMYGNFLVRAAQTNALSPTNIPLNAVYTLNYNNHDKFTTVGMQYDNGKAIALAELTRRRENAAPEVGLPLSAGADGYVAAGWHVGKLTPLLIYGQERPSKTLISVAARLQTTSFCLRYDAVANLAFKAEISRSPAGSTYWTVPSFTSAERVNVYSLGADFVF